MTCRRGGQSALTAYSEVSEVGEVKAATTICGAKLGCELSVNFAASQSVDRQSSPRMPMSSRLLLDCEATWKAGHKMGQRRVDDRCRLVAPKAVDHQLLPRGAAVHREVLGDSIGRLLHTLSGTDR